MWESQLKSISHLEIQNLRKLISKNKNDNLDKYAYIETFARNYVNEKW